jgi:hypothetical protein
MRTLTYITIHWLCQDGETFQSSNTSVPTKLGSCSDGSSSFIRPQKLGESITYVADEPVPEEPVPRLVRSVFIPFSSKSQLILLQAGGKKRVLGSTNTRHAKGRVTVDCGRILKSARTSTTHRTPHAVLQTKEPMLQTAGYAAEVMFAQPMTHAHGCVIQG